MLWFVPDSTVTTGPSAPERAGTQAHGQQREQAQQLACIGKGPPCKDVATNQRHRDALLLDWRRVLPPLLEYPHQQLALEVVVLKAVPLSACDILHTAPGPRSAPPRVLPRSAQTRARRARRTRRGRARGGHAQRGRGAPLSSGGCPWAAPGRSLSSRLPAGRACRIAAVASAPAAFGAAAASARQAAGPLPPPWHS